MFLHRRPTEVSKGLDVSRDSGLWDRLLISLLMWLLAESPLVTVSSSLPLSACLYIPLTRLFITMGFCRAWINHLHSEPKKRHGEADAIKRAAQLSFPSRQASPKITGSWNIHLRAERAPLWAGSCGLWNHKGLGFLGPGPNCRAWGWAGFGSAGAWSWTWL